MNGIRGERLFTLDLDLAGAKARFRGSVMDMRTMVGELYLEADTLLVTFTRGSP